MTSIILDIKNQLQQPTSDGMQDENREFNCVPTCLAMVFEYLTGRKFNADEIKDAVYGQGYIGATSAANYIRYAREQGINLYPVQGTGAALVQEIHRRIQRGQPCIATEPDPYVNPRLDWSHVILFNSELPGQLSAIDPFGGHAVQHSDLTWASLLEFNEIWVAERIQGAHHMNIPHGWNDDGTTLKSPNGVPIVKGFREYILNAPSWDPNNWALAPEQNMAQLEQSNPQIGAGSEQVFRMSRLEWTPERGVFEGWIGQEFLYFRSHIGTIMNNNAAVANLRAAIAMITATAQHAMELTNDIH